MPDTRVWAESAEKLPGKLAEEAYLGSVDLESTGSHFGRRVQLFSRKLLQAASNRKA